MKKPTVNFDELRATLFAAIEGGVACDVINQLAKHAEKGVDDAKRILAAYTLEGSIWHMRSYACAVLAKSIDQLSPDFADVFRKGLTDPDVRYWSILGLV